MPTHETRLVSTRLALAGLRVHSALVFFFLIAPIIAIVPLSFNSGSYFSYPMDGFSLRWYAQAFGSQNWQHAFANSMGIGAAATLISTGLGTLAALGLARADFPLRGLVMPLLISPMIIPIVVVAAGFYLVFAPLGLVDSYAGVVLAHAALGTPFVVITVTASLLSFDRSLLRAAAGLGASQWTVFRRVTLPLILPAVATGSIFAFATSFDEVIVILFIGGPAQQTVPRRMWSGIRDQIDPSILAVATVLIVFAVALFSSINWLRSRAQAASAAIDA
ncbi:ABC transporter permease [Paraburkholderia caballeronis]|uniref:Putative spermidine/putrescine transport system permease protein n=1 Tax=Paraburkholderia caballeronis TaxID=416943 RepID=A0A1H7QKQ8_9BURK|nr:ABC transporter permease [Paraburkholderia caballeronis]PXW22518.1 putative spermidine/putrescine transport system permease protein [Paraburkholderia caballeronis]PXW96389.1 putative spermidine/putrescine transport system permease protein [Paraburkholderia caballeronis]RAJ92800.1 putative spermidine/putrescine transport system permease protein [Paraburkholderia caballeronis]SEE04734.1 putative spermidine/putrescine transport system permease protein [Paraburkholderia caballeronis]SEL48185.1 